MAQNPQEIKDRLKNIHAIKPLLTALRTISLANWKQAINKQTLLKEYLRDLNEIYFFLSPQYPRKQIAGITPIEIIIAIGSNRGLCGNFNRNIVDELTKSVNNEGSDKKKVIIYGERLKKYLVRRNIIFDKFYNFQNPGSNMLNHITNLASHFLSTDIPYKISAIYNEYSGAAKHHTISKIIFPFSVDHNIRNNVEFSDFIFDTDQYAILEHLEKHLGFLSLYSSFLSSAASEHSTRFQIMESSSKNAERLSEELEIDVQFHRRQKITSEMQELAVSAGLLEKK